MVCQLKGSAAIVRLLVADPIAALTDTELLLPPAKYSASVVPVVGTEPEANMALGTLSKPRTKFDGIIGWVVIARLEVKTAAKGLDPPIAVGAAANDIVGE